MGVIVEEHEFTTAITPTRLFKAFIVDSPNLLPKLMPSVVKSIDIIEGDGGVGSIKMFTLCQEGQISTVKHKIEELDETNCVYKYSEIASDFLDEYILEPPQVVVKIEEGPNGGSIYKVVVTYNIKGDNHNFIQEKIKKVKEAGEAFMKNVEAHLLSNPNEYK